MEDQGEVSNQPILPYVRQPKGLAYLFGSWSGRLLLVNSLVFVYLAIRSGSLFVPDTETLLALGAKDPVKLANGEIWRLLAPIFIHIGIVHFGFNSYFLYAIGYQIERILGGAWFLFIYLASGVAGNIASALFSVNLSAGASSSLFGLLGAGLFLERFIGRRIKEATGRRPANRAYLMTVVINLGFGFVVPFIDNAAHLGGLAAGTILTLSMINLRPNRLQRRRVAIGVTALALFFGFCAVGTSLSTSKSFAGRKFVEAAEKAKDVDEKIYHYSQALEINPRDAGLRLKRASAFFATGESAYALQDVRTILAETSDFNADLDFLAKELEDKGRSNDAWELRRLLSRVEVHL